jgi:hypothetical protein
MSTKQKDKTFVKKNFGGDIYFGELQNGNRNGEGVNLYGSGYIYKGGWKEN